MTSRQLSLGIAFGMLAGLCWGIIFAVPMLLPEYPPLALSAGRYLAFGLVVLVPALLDRARLRQLTRADWLKAGELALVGNLIYYACIASAVQLAGGAMTAMIIGTLPVTISLTGALLDHRVQLRRLWLPLAVILAGLALVHLDEFRAPGGGHGEHYGWGLVIACGALACWTWYPVRNALWIKSRPSLSMSTWATAQGLATLPLALVAFVLLAGLPDYDWPLGAQPARYLGLMLALGVCASWLGTVCWNQTSRLLPTALSGQMIVFETIFGMAFVFAVRGDWPDGLALAGLALLVVGVMLGVRSLSGRGA